MMGDDAEARRGEATGTDDWPFRRPGVIEFITDVGFPEPGFPPMQFHVDGEIQGLDIDLGREIARRLGAEADFLDRPLADMIHILESGIGDALICGLTDRPQRRERVSFLHYLRIGQTVLVPVGNPLGIVSAADLAGRKVVTYGEASTASSLAAVDRSNQAAGLQAMYIACITGTTGTSTRREREAVQRGEADADFIDIHSALWSDRQYDDVEVAPFVVNEEPAGIAFRKSDTIAQELMQQTVAEMYADGTFEHILASWDLQRLGLGNQIAVKISA